jgi:hypothetical protein
VAPIRRSATGSITAITSWLHYAGQRVAPIRRSSTGSNMPVGDNNPLTCTDPSGLQAVLPVRSASATQAFIRESAMVTVGVYISTAAADLAFNGAPRPVIIPKISQATCACSTPEGIESYINANRAFIEAQGGDVDKIIRDMRASYQSAMNNMAVGSALMQFTAGVDSQLTAASYSYLFYAQQRLGLVSEDENESPHIKIYHYKNGEWSEADDEITSNKRFVNGINNTEDQAKRIALKEMEKNGIREFDLVYIPTLGFLDDLIRALADKLGLTTQTANELAGIIRQTGPGDWYAHSYGGVAFAEAVRILGKDMSPGQSVTFLAGANNEWVTNSIMRDAGVNVRGYPNSWWDLVPHIVGLNSGNPIQWVANILASWTLATPWSPHTYPPVK